MSKFEQFWFKSGAVCSAVTLAIFLYQVVSDDVRLERSVFAWLGPDAVSIIGGAVAILCIFLYLVFMLRTMRVLRKLAAKNVRGPGGGQFFWAIVTFFSMPVGVWFIYPRLKSTLTLLSSGNRDE